MIDRDEMERAIFRGKLNRAIEKRDIKQTDVCKALGIPNSTLNDWTAGVRPISHYRRVELAKFFGFSSSDALFSNDGDFTEQELNALREEIKRLEMRNYYLENQMLLPCFEVTDKNDGSGVTDHGGFFE